MYVQQYIISKFVSCTCLHMYTFVCAVACVYCMCLACIYFHVFLCIISFIICMDVSLSYTRQYLYGHQLLCSVLGCWISIAAGSLVSSCHPLYFSAITAKMGRWAACVTIKSIDPSNSSFEVHSTLRTCMLSTCIGRFGFPGMGALDIHV